MFYCFIVLYIFPCSPPLQMTSSHKFCGLRKIKAVVLKEEVCRRSQSMGSLCLVIVSQDIRYCSEPYNHACLSAAMLPAVTVMNSNPLKL